MLGKLIKHEWKAVWKVPALLLGILMIIAAVAGLTFALPIWDSDWIGLPMSGIMLIMMFYVAMIGVSLGIVIYLAVRYFKNMFTDEGYLTHTLPVTSRQLLISKVMIMSVWELLSSIFFGIQGGRFCFACDRSHERIGELVGYAIFQRFSDFRRKHSFYGTGELL